MTISFVASRVNNRPAMRARREAPPKMPIEQSRKTHVQWISGTFVAINVIDEITFVDPDDRFQETAFTFQNISNPDGSWPATTRTTHVIIAGTPFEVIEEFKVVDQASRNQESWFSLLSSDSSSSNKLIHLKTHIVSFWNNTTNFPYSQPGGSYQNLGPLVAVERIDKISVIDPTDQHRETVYELNNTDNDFGVGVVTIPDDQINNSVATPIRLDPFQNVVGMTYIGVQTTFERHVFVSDGTVPNATASYLSFNGNHFVGRANPDPNQLDPGRAGNFVGWIDEGLDVNKPFLQPGEKMYDDYTVVRPLATDGSNQYVPTLFNVGIDTMKVISPDKASVDTLTTPTSIENHSGLYSSVLPGPGGYIDNRSTLVKFYILTQPTKG
jgi:hypothetical protein